MSQLFFLTLACVVGFVAAGPINGPCCLKKTVGNVSYTHVEQTDTSEYDCLSNCVYEQDAVPGSRFCFAHGELPVVCNGLGRPPYETVFCGEDLKNLLEAFSETNTTLAARCCAKGPISTCYGHDCKDLCDVEVKCLKLVHYGDLSNDEHCRNRNLSPDILLALPPICNTGQCPTTYPSAESICCKDSGYQTRCILNDFDTCKCHVTCGFFAKYANTNSFLCDDVFSWCCSCPSYKSACPTTCKGGSSPQPYTADPTPEPTTCPINTSDPNCDRCKEPGYLEACPIQCKCNCFCESVIKHTSFCYPEWSSCCECTGLGNYNTNCKSEVCDIMD